MNTLQSYSFSYISCNTSEEKQTVTQEGTLKTATFQVRKLNQTPLSKIFRDQQILTTEATQIASSQENMTRILLRSSLCDEVVDRVK